MNVAANSDEIKPDEIDEMEQKEWRQWKIQAAIQTIKATNSARKNRKPAT